jgi:probable HAF family extracellular repeat protein
MRNAPATRASIRRRNRAVRMLRFAAAGGVMSPHSSRTRPALVVGAALFFVTVATSPFKPATLQASGALYTVTDLGALNCCYDWVYASAARAVNAHGDVAGFTSSPTDPKKIIPFVYQNGTMTAISDNPGWATSINDAGEVTGFVWFPGEANGHAFRYLNGVLTDVGTLPGDTNRPYSIGWAINNSGTIAGESGNDAWIVDDTGDMWRLKRQSARAAYGINDAGDVVGLLSPVVGGPYSNHGFLFDGHSMLELPTLDGDPTSVSVPMAVNSSRQVAGYGWRNGNSEQRAFLYENGVTKDLGTLEDPRFESHWSSGHAINSFGHVVGISDASTFLYRDGVMLDLNHAIDKDPGGIWPYVYIVLAINDAGQIAGTCYLDGPSGVTIRACLLTPVTP